MLQLTVLCVVIRDEASTDHGLHKTGRNGSGRRLRLGDEAGLLLLVCTQHTMICEDNQANRCNLFDMLSGRMYTSTQRPSIATTHESEHLRNFFLGLRDMFTS